jgi:hypothetical protein
VTGLLTELPNKNGNTMAQAVPGTSAQRLQEFFTNMQWDAEDRNRQRVQKMSAESTLGDGVLALAGLLPGESPATGDEPVSASRSAGAGVAALAVADDSVATGYQRVAAQEVCGRALLARHPCGATACRPTAGRARHAWAA